MTVNITHIGWSCLYSSSYFMAGAARFLILSEHFVGAKSAARTARATTYYVFHTIAKNPFTVS